MKTQTILLLCLAFVLSSCGSTSSIQSVTRHPDGSTTTTNTPVLNPEDAAFNARCDKVLERKF